MFYQTQIAHRRPKGPKNSVFCPWWPWPLTCDILVYLYTRPSEGSNTSSVWICRKSVQRFPIYFIHNKKPQTDGAKNRTFRRSLHAVIITSSFAPSDHRPIFPVNLCSVKSIAFFSRPHSNVSAYPTSRICSVCDIDVLWLYAPNVLRWSLVQRLPQKTRNSYSVLDCDPNLTTEKEAHHRKWSVKMGKFSFLARPRSAIPAATELL